MEPEMAYDGNPRPADPECSKQICIFKRKTRGDQHPRIINESRVHESQKFGDFFFLEKMGLHGEPTGHEKNPRG
jgi:hypothetical protein